MTKIIDMFGKPCPMPLVAAKKEISEGCRDLSVRVDNETAVKNLSRLGGKTGLNIDVDEVEGGWVVTFSEPADGAEPVIAAMPQGSASGAAVCVPTGGCGYAVFVSKDHLGEGDPQLGHNLVKMALYTFGQADVIPTSLLFMNSGVKLLCEEGQIVDNVREMAEQGTEVLVCGTCLDYYGVKDQLQVGEVSNMYDILERMHEASKVITL